MINKDRDAGVQIRTTDFVICAFILALGMVNFFDMINQWSAIKTNNKVAWCGVHLFTGSRKDAYDCGIMDE